jgi:hypothetical protein
MTITIDVLPGSFINWPHAVVFNPAVAIRDIGYPVADATSAIRLNEGLPFGESDL